MKVNWYAIVTNAVEEGVNAGLTLARQHEEDDPHLETRIYDEIMARLCEVITFAEDE